MEKFDLSLTWMIFQNHQKGVLNLLRDAAAQVRNSEIGFIYKAEDLEELFLNLNGSLLEFAEIFEADQTCVLYVYDLEGALEELHSGHSSLKELTAGGHTEVWRFLDDLEGQILDSMNRFDALFKMTRAPLAFVAVDKMLEASATTAAYKDEQARELFQKELQEIGSFRSRAGNSEKQVEFGGLDDVLREKLGPQGLLVFEKLNNADRKGFWDVEILQFCLERGSASKEFQLPVFLEMLQAFVMALKGRPERSAAFRLCFFHLMEFHRSPCYLGFSKMGRYKALRIICNLRPEEEEDLEASLPDLRRALLWIKETGMDLKTEDFQPEKFLGFLQKTEPLGLHLGNPGRITLFYKMNLINMPSYDGLKFKNDKKTSLQVFAQTSFRSISTCLYEKENDENWAKEKEVEALVKEFSEKA